jgi:polyhydroxybutyrate depolymerase
MNGTTHDITVEGTRRSFVAFEPSGPVAAIVLSLHGSRSSTAGQVRLSQMQRLAERGDALVVFPQAIVPIGSGFEWDLDGDIGYLSQLVDELRSRHPTPQNRVCISGMSGGARMSCHFAAARADAVAMVGAVAGLRSPRGRPLSRPVPVVAFHGTADRINPYSGSGTPRWDESVPEAARCWAVANGVSTPPNEVAVSGSLSRTTYGVEGQGGEVTLWTVRGAGHTWPGGRLGLLLRMFLGRTNTEIDAADEIWAFAQRHLPLA